MDNVFRNCLLFWPKRSIKYPKIFQMGKTDTLRASFKSNGKNDFMDLEVIPKKQDHNNKIFIWI